MDFLNDYWTYHSCYEIPRNYAVWSGVALLGSVINRKVVYVHGDIEIHPTEYIGLIGPQGSSKSTCCSFARDLFKEACPDLQVGPSRASPESIVKIMNDSKFARSYTNSAGETVEVRPFAFYINEFKNFVGRSPFDMLTFLTDIYDVKAYDASTIVRGMEYIVNPAINLLCCETPEWIIRNIKGDVISGGFGRRIVYVYETDDVIDRPVPIITPEAKQARERVKQRLINVRSLSGTYTWESKGVRYYELWYKANSINRRKEQNAMMRGYLRTKHVQLFKLMMLLDAVKDKPMMCFTVSGLDEALSYIDGVEENMNKLSQSAGRNVLLSAQQKVIEILDKSETWVQDFELRRLIENELNPMETTITLKHLEDTKQIIRRNVNFPGYGECVGYTSIAKYKDMNEKREIEIHKRGKPQPSDSPPTSD